MLFRSHLTHFSSHQTRSRKYFGNRFSNSTNDVQVVQIRWNFASLFGILQQLSNKLAFRIPYALKNVKVQLVFPTIVTGNMEEYVTNASKFMPERWLKGSSYGTIHPYASLPYGHGARMCLGRRFADLEIQVLLAKLLRSYRLEYHHEPLEYKVTFMYAPDGALKFKMLPR